MFQIEKPRNWNLQHQISINHLSSAKGNVLKSHLWRIINDGLWHFFEKYCNCVCILCKHVALLLYDETFHQIRPILT